MSTLATPKHPAAALRRFWFTLPLVVLLGVGFMANAGLDPTPTATGATTGNVLVTSNVGSTLDVADGCAGVMSVTVAMGAYAGGSCPVNFGASNDASVNLRASSSAGAFLTPANFVDEGGTCANLSAADEVGLKVVAVTAPTTNTWGCASGGATDNTLISHKGVPDAFTNVCLSAALGTTNTCTLGVGVFEFGSNATAGAYTGTLNLDVIG